MKTKLKHTVDAPAAEPMDPIAVPLLEAVRLSGMSRRTLYRDLADGKIKAVKRGHATLVMMDSLRGYLAALPPATFGSKRAA